MDINEYRRAYESRYGGARQEPVQQTTPQPAQALPMEPQRRVAATLPGDATTEQLIDEAMANQPPAPAQAPQPQAGLSQMAGSSGLTSPSFPQGQFGTLMKMLRGSALGAGQALIDLPISVLNTPAALMSSNLKIPHPNLGKYAGSGGPEQIAYQATQFGVPVYGFGKFVPKIAKALPYLKHLRGKSAIARDALTGAGLGYATGETDEKSNLGRYLSGALQGALGAVGRLKSNRIVDEIKEDREKIMKSFKEGYENLLSKGDEVPVDQLKTVPMSRVMRKELAISKRAIGNYIRNPNIRNAHELQSKLGADIRGLKLAKKRKGTLTSNQQEAYEQAIKTQGRLRAKIKNGLDKFGLDQGQVPGLGKEYDRITKEYENYAVPYLNPVIEEALSEYSKGRLKPKIALEDIAGTKSFKRRLAPYYPEVEMRKYLNKLWKPLAYGGASFLGGSLALKSALKEAPGLIDSLSSSTEYPK